MLRVAVLLPTGFAVRDVIETPVLGLLAEQANLMVTLLTSNQDDGKRILELGLDHIRWAHIERPVSRINSFASSDLARNLRRFAYRVLLFWFRGRTGFGTLAYRFNHIQRFTGHLQKVHLPPSRRHREAIAGNFVDWRYGIPFPRNRSLFRLLYRLYYSMWDGDVHVEAFFDHFAPDLLVLSYVQNYKIRPYSIAARRRNIPTLGLIGSWDKLTTKGPLGPGISRFVVGSQVMRWELETYHSVPREKIEVIGWPKMDLYKKPGIIRPRRTLLESLGVPLERRLLLFGGNSPRLGKFEPTIARHLALQVKKCAYVGPCTLFIRPHPKDGQWEARFRELHQPPDVIVQRPEAGRLDYLTNLLFHADVLIASQGSICLDAIALDTCVINIAFDGDAAVNFYESTRRWYELDHYRPVITNKASRLVENYKELDEAVVRYLRDPEKDAESRARVRILELEPFDGKASKRLINLITDHAGAASAGH